MIKLQTITVMDEEFTFDIWNMDDKKRFNAAWPPLVDSLEKSSCKSDDELIALCEAIMDFLNAVLGAGADEKIFGGHTNPLFCIEALGDFMAEVGPEASGVRMQELLDKKNGRLGALLANRVTQKSGKKEPAKREA